MVGIVVLIKVDMIVEVSRAVVIVVVKVVTAVEIEGGRVVNIHRSIICTRFISLLHAENC